MRATAQVGEVAFAVQRNGLLTGDGFDEFGLVLLAKPLEVIDSFLAADNPARHRLIAAGDFAHALFDGRQIFGRERARIGKVVVKAVFDDRTNGDLRFGKQLFHRVGQQVGRRVADDFQPLGIFGGQQSDLRILLDQVGQIDEFTVNTSRNGGLGQTGADIGSKVGRGERLVEPAHRSIWQC